MKSRPRMLMCPLCGREFGTKSLPIHYPQCTRKWLAQEALKPARERRPLPVLPTALADAMAGGTVPKNAREIQEFNEQMTHKFETESLECCTICGRSFNERAFKKHQELCTPFKPFRPKGTALGSQSLSTKLAPGKISGTRHEQAYLPPIVAPEDLKGAPNNSPAYVLPEEQPVGGTALLSHRLSEPTKNVPLQPASSKLGTLRAVKINATTARILSPGTSVPAGAAEDLLEISARSQAAELAAAKENALAGVAAAAAAGDAPTAEAAEIASPVAATEMVRSTRKKGDLPELPLEVLALAHDVCMDALGPHGTAALIRYLREQRVMGLQDLQFLQLDWLMAALQPAGVPPLILNKFLTLAKQRAALDT